MGNSLWWSLGGPLSWRITVFAPAGCAEQLENYVNTWLSVWEEKKGTTHGLENLSAFWLPVSASGIRNLESIMNENEKKKSMTWKGEGTHRGERQTFKG